MPSIYINGQMNSCGNGQFDIFLSNSSIINAEVTASVPQVQLCDNSYSLNNSNVCANMSKPIAPRHPFPPGPLLVACMETRDCGFPHFNNALLSGHDNATALCNVDRFNYCFFVIHTL